ncbi:MAG: hypothetical protein J7L46_04660 [Bacteroidales bacterium]|nr:hypothetical protein [Bacteroidales bacterium]
MANQLKDEFFSSLKEYIPNKKSYLIAVGCLLLSLFLFAYPQKALELISIKQTPQSELLIKWLVPPWIMFLGLLSVYVLSLRFYRSTKNLKSWRFDKKITLNVGDYFDVKTENDYPLRIELKKISKEQMPPPYICIPESKDNEIKTETATVMFSPAFIYPGRCVKKVENNHSGSFEETFIMPKYQTPEEDLSVFFFNVTNSTNGARFFRCHIEHINPNKQQVELDVYYLWVDRNQLK